MERLRADACYIPALALVAEVQGRIAGHVLFTRLTVGDDGRAALAVGPLSVLPAFQGQGIGGALLTRGHEIAKRAGYCFCVLLGHADYYPRFGYLPASRFGLRSPFEVSAENYMALCLQENPPPLTGAIKYPVPWEIG